MKSTVKLLSIEAILASVAALRDSLTVTEEATVVVVDVVPPGILVLPHV